MASPLTIINRHDDGQDIQAVVAIIDQYQVEEVVVGWPLSMDGTPGKQAEKVQAFVQELSRHINLPIKLRDERLTTVSARRLLQAATTRKARQKVEDDAAAAAIILQAYLDEMRDSNEAGDS